MEVARCKSRVRVTEFNSNQYAFFSLIIILNNMGTFVNLRALDREVGYLDSLFFPIGKPRIS